MVIYGGGAWAGIEEEPGGGAEVRPGGSSLWGCGLFLDCTYDVIVTTKDNLDRAGRKIDVEY